MPWHDAYWWLDLNYMYVISTSAALAHLPDNISSVAPHLEGSCVLALSAQDVTGLDQGFFCRCKRQALIQTPPFL